MLICGLQVGGLRASAALDVSSLSSLEALHSVFMTREGLLLSQLASRMAGAGVRHSKEVSRSHLETCSSLASCS